MKKFLLPVIASAVSLFASCNKDDNDYPSNNYRYHYNESGLYLNVCGFNSAPRSLSYDGSPFIRLTPQSASDFESFIRSLTTDDGTVLYYSVESAISQLQTTEFPDDLKNVSIITFTDGLDQGSTAMNSSYSSATDYLSAISNKLQTTRINGQKINAYSIGLKGRDVANETLFKQNLNGLASSPANAMEVSNISEVNARFQELAASLRDENTSQSLTLTIPQPYENTRIRFTFDVGSNATAGDSQYYIEGIYKSDALTNVRYYGLQCANGNTVPVSSKSGINVSFRFENLEFSYGFEMSVSNIRQWEWVNSSGGIWQINSEFNPAKSTQTTVKESSAAIILLLDCSSSLGSDIDAVKTAAINFINILVNGSSGNGNSGNSGNSGSNTLYYGDSTLTGDIRVSNIYTASFGYYGDYYKSGMDNYYLHLTGNNNEHIGIDIQIYPGMQPTGYFIIDVSKFQWTDSIIPGLMDAEKTMYGSWYYKYSYSGDTITDYAPALYGYVSIEQNYNGYYDVDINFQDRNGYSVKCSYYGSIGLESYTRTSDSEMTGTGRQVKCPLR